MFVEQYRRLGAALHQAQLYDGVRSVMVASALESEGKTLSATNLALVLSRSFNKRVLLVDGDLRKPAIHEGLQLENDSGLSDILERPDWRLLLQRVSPTLSVMTGGHHNPDPVALLTSHAVDRFLLEACADFEWVVVDTPPILLFPDAGLFAGRLGTCVMVVNAGSTASPAAAKAVASIGVSSILGAVLNRADPADVAEGYGYSHYGYDGSGEARRRFAWWPARQR